MEDNKQKKEVKITAKEYATMKGYNSRTIFAAGKIFKNDLKSDKDWNGLFIKKGLIDKK